MAKKSLNMKKKLGLEDLEVYKLAMTIGENVWSVVQTMDEFARETVGKQLVRSADSVAANISEGFGRFHYKDRKLFLYYSRGSLYETKTWLQKAFNRSIIDRNDYDQYSNEIKNLSVKLNNYIHPIGNQTGNYLHDPDPNEEII